MTKKKFTASTLSREDLIRIKRALRFENLKVGEMYWLLGKFYSIIGGGYDMDPLDITKRTPLKLVMRNLTEAKIFFQDALDYPAWNHVERLREDRYEEVKLIFGLDNMPYIYTDDNLVVLDKYFSKYWLEFMEIEK